MNEFAWLAEELTDLEERMGAPDLKKYSAALCRALQKAFVEASKAARKMRHDQEALAAIAPNVRTVLRA